MAKIEIIKSMLSDDKENAHAWFLLGLEQAERGNHTEAMQAFTKALAYGNEKIKGKIITELNRLQEDTALFATGKGSERWATSPYSLTPAAQIPMLERGSGKTIAKQEERSAFPTRYQAVGGLEHVKAAIHDTLFAFARQPEGHAELVPRKGVLLYGPPGCGKSLLAKATAEEYGAHFLPVPAAVSGDAVLGRAESFVPSVYGHAASKEAACLVFLDELDGAVCQPDVFASSHSLPPAGEWLSQLRELEIDKDRLRVLGATNVPWEIDLAWMRENGFERLLFVGPPDRAAREDIFRLKLQDRPSEPIDYSQLAGWTEYYSGADIEYVVELATEQVFHDLLTKGIERPIQMSDLRESIAATRPTTIEWLRTIKEHLPKINAGGDYAAVEQYLAMHRRI